MSSSTAIAPSPPTAMPGSGAGGSVRARRAETSYSSASSLGPFDILNVKLRVVTPPRPLPLDSYDEKAYYFIRELFGKEFQIKAAQIASEGGIPNVDATLKARVFRDDPLDTQPAIFIVVNEWTADSPRLWQSVVEKVKKHVDGRVVETPETRNVDISVEMVAEDLQREKYLSLLYKDATYPYVMEAWPCIKGRIFNILESFSATAGHMTAIALFKLGPRRYHNHPQTVYVSVGYESPESGWPPVVEKMQTFLDEFRLGLRAHMEHNTMGPRIFHLRETNLTEVERSEQIRDFVSNLPARTRHHLTLGRTSGRAATYNGRTGGSQAPCSAPWVVGSTPTSKEKARRPWPRRVIIS